jgi:hypothetical protein
VSYLPLTAGDKSIKCARLSCPDTCIWTPWRWEKRVSHLHRLAQCTATHAWKSPERCAGRSTGAMIQWQYGAAPCRGGYLAADHTLPRAMPCRGGSLSGSWIDFPASSSCRGLGQPSRQAPLAGALSLRLAYFVLEWLLSSLGTAFGYHPASLAAGRCYCPCTSTGY